MKLIEIWYFLPMIIFTSYYPGIIESLVKSRDLFLFQIEKVAVMMVKVFWLIAIPMIIASPFLGKMLYGEKYADISNLIIVQVFLLFFVCLNTIRNAYFFSLNLTKEIAFLNFLTLISVYFICKCLFAKFGILGMSYGMVISYFLGTIVFSYFLKSNRVIFFILIKAAIYPFKIDFKNGSK
jgi:O-antigen/teichoic acid export membrane protein